MKKKKDSKKAICDAAIKLAGKSAWSTITLSQIAKEAKISLPKLKALYFETSDILPDIISQTDKKVSALANIDFQNNSHDRLFEIFMTRFEILQKNRKSVLSIGNACKNDPKLLRIVFKSHFESMKKTLELAKLIEPGIIGITQILCICAVYQFTTYHWMEDNSKDLSKTMAVLDNSLNKAQIVGSLLSYAQ